MGKTGRKSEPPKQQGDKPKKPEQAPVDDDDYEDGDIAILKHGKEKQLIREINMGSPIYTTPVAHQGVLFVTTRSRLFAIAGK